MVPIIRPTYFMHFVSYNEFHCTTLPRLACLLGGASIKMGDRALPPPKSTLMDVALWADRVKLGNAYVLMWSVNCITFIAIQSNLAFR